jgi:hypothetical protein
MYSRPVPMQIQLVRKLANHLDGIDVTAYGQGDVIDLPRRDAELLIAEQWAVAHCGPASREVRNVSATPQMAIAADRLARRSLDQMRRFREEMEMKRFEEQERRRAEDRIREELHDEHAKTIHGDDAARIMRRDA